MEPETEEELDKEAPAEVRYVILARLSLGYLSRPKVVRGVGLN
jgi:hypothetical protein